MVNAGTWSVSEMGSRFIKRLLMYQQFMFISIWFDELSSQMCEMIENRKECHKHRIMGFNYSSHEEALYLRAINHLMFFDPFLCEMILRFSLHALSGSKQSQPTTPCSPFKAYRQPEPARELSRFVTSYFFRLSYFLLYARKMIFVRFLEKRNYVKNISRKYKFS